MTLHPIEPYSNVLGFQILGAKLKAILKGESTSAHFDHENLTGTTFIKCTFDHAKIAFPELRN